MVENGESDLPYSEDHPAVQANQERVKNHLYRAIHSEEIDIEPSDVELIHDALDTMTEDELYEMADYEIALEDEVFEMGRKELDFDELSESEKEYLDFLTDKLDRVR